MVVSESDLISVVVPVYNVEDYIENTLKSISAQTYGNLEILVIDDGSTDGSYARCEKIARFDPRITIIRKHNGGLSSARNVGIEAAKGKYISFVDGDDLIDSKYIEFLYKAIKKNNSDVSICALKRIKEANQYSVKQDNYPNISLLSNKCCIKRMLLSRDISISACGKLYLIDLWDKFRFPEGHYYEDIATIPVVIASSKTSCISYLDYPGYGYIVRRGSITGSLSISEKRLADANDELNKLKECLSLYDESLLEFYKHYRASIWLSLYRYIINSKNVNDDVLYRVTGYLKNESRKYMHDRRLPQLIRIRYFLFSVSPKLYLAIFELYARLSGLSLV